MQPTDSFRQAGGLARGKGCTVRGFLKAGLASAAHLTRRRSPVCRMRPAPSRGVGARLPPGRGRFRPGSVRTPFRRCWSAGRCSSVTWTGSLGAFRWSVSTSSAAGSKTLAPRARPIAAITFDDGYRDVYEQAFPLLMRKGIPATVFVATNYVDTSGVLPHDRLYLLLARASHRWSFVHAPASRAAATPRAPAAGASGGRGGDVGPVGAENAAYLALRVRRAANHHGARSGLRVVGRGAKWLPADDVGHADRDDAAPASCVGSHTRSHCLLTNEQPAKVIEETAGSQQALAAKLGQPATCFAYPDGRFDATAVRAVAAAGYRIAVTTCRHRDADHPWLTVPRLLLWERSSVDARGRFSPAILSCQVSGLFDRVSMCRQPHGAADTTRPSHGERNTSAHRLQRIVSLSGR